MPVSHVRSFDKRKLLKLCQDKERQGFECIQPIQKRFVPRKNFKNVQGRQEYLSTDYDSYYEAVYQK